MNQSQLTLARIDGDTLLRRRPVFFQRDSILPWTIYVILKELFGAPNGKPASEREQWCYELSAPSAQIRIRDWNQCSWTLEVYSDSGREEDGQRVANEFLKFVATRGQRFDREAKALVKSSRFRLIQNPFRMYFDSADGLLALHEEVANQKERSDLCRAAFFLFLSSFEGLLNLVYDLYLKPFLNEERIRKDLIRANIDLKLRLAPIYCSCFAGDTIRYKSDEQQRYVAIVELRNDFIHANVSPLMKTVLVKHDGFTFQIQRSDNPKFPIPTLLASMDIEHLRFIRGTIDEMADAVISSMNHKFRHAFAKAILLEQFIVETVDGENLLRLGNF